MVEDRTMTHWLLMQSFYTQANISCILTIKVILMNALKQASLVKRSKQ